MSDKEDVMGEGMPVVERDPWSDDVFVNGRRITYADWRAEMERPSLVGLAPSVRGRVAWERLVRSALDAR